MTGVGMVVTVFFAAVVIAVVARFMSSCEWHGRIARAAAKGELIEIGNLRYRVTLAERKDWQKDEQP